MRPRRVALVTDAIHPYHRGGKEQRYYELAHRLAARGLDVHVYTMKWWRGPSVIRDGKVTLHALSPLLPLYAGARRSLLQALVFGLCCLRLLFVRVDVIEADHIPYTPVLALRVVAWVRRKRLVVTWHEVWGAEAWKTYLGPLGRIAWGLERLCMRLPDELLAASQQTADRLHQHLGPDADITVAPHGIDIEEVLRADVEVVPTDVVYVGRLLEHKRVDLVVAAIAVLADEGMRLHARIIGTGPETQRLRAQIVDLGVEDLVELRHDIADHGELFSHLKSGRVFCFPSQREGFGLAVLEALACGLPVVTSAHPDNLARHLIDSEEKGVVCEPTARAVADGIRRVLAARADGTRVYDLSAYGWPEVTRRVETALAS